MSRIIHLNDPEVKLPVPGTTLEDQNALISAGYAVVLCDGKAAKVPAWQTKMVTLESNAQDRAQHPGLTNTGVRCGRLVGIDIDLHDPEHALAIAKLVKRMLGASAFVRVGSKGCAIFYYCPEGITSSTIRGIAPGEGGAKALLEVFGAEKQMVMFGIHPDTGRPYSWANKSLLDAPLEDLPPVTPKMIADMRVAVANRLEGLGYTKINRPEAVGSNIGVASDDIHPVAPEWLVDMFDVPAVGKGCDRMDWIGWAAVWKFTPLVDAKTGEPFEDFDRFEAFHEWSSGERGDRGSYESPEDCLTTWNSLGTQDKRAGGVGAKTIRSLVKLAKDGGYTGGTMWVKDDPREVPETPAVEKLRGVIEASEEAGPALSPVEVLNDQYAIMTGGKFVGLIADFSDPFAPNFMAEAKFNSRFRHITVPFVNSEGKESHISISRRWCTWSDRREVSDIVFCPPGSRRRVPDGAYNMWRGFAVEPEKGDAHRPFLDHLLINVCDMDEDLYAWVLAWMADLVQKPGDKPGLALALKGKTGAGKTIVYDYLKHMFGVHAQTVSKPSHVVGSFNAHLAGCVLLGVEEGFWAGDTSAESTLKHLITGSQMTLERKGVDAIEVDNHLHLLVTSNERWVIPAGEGERRWTVLEVADNYAQGVSGRDGFWKPIVDARDNGTGPACLLHFLLHHKYDPKLLRAPLQTAAKAQQSVASMKSIEQWFNSVLKGDRDPSKTLSNNVERVRGDDEPEGQTDSIFGTAVLKSTIHGDYMAFAREHRHLRVETDSVFWQHIRPCVDGKIEFTRPWADGQIRPAFATFPQRADCRAMFAKMYGTDWEGLAG